MTKGIKKQNLQTSECMSWPIFNVSCVTQWHDNIDSSVPASCLHCLVITPGLHKMDSEDPNTLGLQSHQPHSIRNRI